MNGEVRDFYYSEKAFNTIHLAQEKGSDEPVVCECFIDGEWLLFTESIGVGRKPLSAWEDLKYLGCSSKLRYTNPSKWAKENITIVNAIKHRQEGM